MQRKELSRSKFGTLFSSKDACIEYLYKQESIRESIYKKCFQERKINMCNSSKVRGFLAHLRIKVNIETIEPETCSVVFKDCDNALHFIKGSTIDMSKISTDYKLVGLVLKVCADKIVVLNSNECKEIPYTAIRCYINNKGE